MKPPFQLKHYFFPTVFVSANKTFKSDTKSSLIYEPQENLVKRTLQASPNNSLKDCLDIVLGIEISGEGIDSIPYNVVLECFGVFELNPEVDDAERVAVVNGGSLLYTAAREFLMTITSRGPFFQVRLPTVSFANYSKTMPGEGQKKQSKVKK